MYYIVGIQTVHVLTTIAIHYEATCRYGIRNIRFLCWHVVCLF